MLISHEMKKAYEILVELYGKGPLSGPGCAWGII
jgi:hypothetical protein